MQAGGGNMAIEALDLQGTSGEAPPPSDLDAEAALLSCVLLDPSALPRARMVVAPEHFYSEAHRQTFKAALDVATAGEPVDSVTVGAHLRDSGRLAQVGGLNVLAALLLRAPTLENGGAYAARVREMWSRRQVILACRQIVTRGYFGQEDAGKLLCGLRASVDRLAGGHASGSSPVPTLSARDLAEPLAPISYLVPGLGLAPGPISLVAGYGFSGKTLALQDLALSVATGGRVWGAFSCRKGRVLHLDYEQGRHLTQERYQRLARARGADLASLEPDALRVACMPSVYVDSDGGADTLASLFDGKALVVVDSLRAAAPSADENSSDVRRPLDILTRAAERTGAAVVVIHHARKPKEQGDAVRFSIRGSSALFDALRERLRPRRNEGTPARQEPSREGPNPRRLPSRLRSPDRRRRWPVGRGALGSPRLAPRD